MKVILHSLIWLSFLSSGCARQEAFHPSSTEVRTESTRNGNNSYSLSGEHPPLASFYHGISDMQNAPAIADEIKAFPEVEDACVLLEGHSAYVGVKLKQPISELQPLQIKIKQKILYLQKGIHQFYFTQNPTAVSHLKRFANELSEGHPLQNHFHQLQLDKVLYQKL